MNLLLMNVKWEGTPQLIQQGNRVNEWGGKSPSLVRREISSEFVEYGNLHTLGVGGGNLQQVPEGNLRHIERKSPQ